MKKIYTVLTILFTLCGSLQVWAQGITLGDAGNFVTIWKTNNEGTSTDNQITTPTFSSSNYNIYWKEVGNPDNAGTVTEVTSSQTLIFPSAGTYRVEINGYFPRIYFNNTGDKDKILTIDPWVSMRLSFIGLP